MTGFLLDTNVPSELVRPQPERGVKTWIAAQNLDRLFISAVSLGEFRKGIILPSPGTTRRKALNLPDGQIAATALEHELTVVTRNVKDFAGLGVTEFNPWDGE